MKQNHHASAQFYLIVAPHTGAWIETAHKNNNIDNKVVAPHTGAWIETRTKIVDFPFLPVAPHTGAWIETPVLS